MRMRTQAKVHVCTMGNAHAHAHASLVHQHVMIICDEICREELTGLNAYAGWWLSQTVLTNKFRSTLSDASRIYAMAVARQVVKSP